MAVGTLDKLTTKGIQRDLQTRLEAFPDWWKAHCTMTTADTKVIPFGWAGSIPQPREMGASRAIQELRAFTYNIENKEYELTVLFPRVWFEDQQFDAIQLRIADMAEAWGLYKIYLFNYMLEQGGTLTAYDGTTFFDDTRTEGSSGTIDNNLTSVAAAATAIPTSAEFTADMGIIKAQMQRFKDDRGNYANISAMQNMRVIAEIDMEAPILEALNATQISGTDNVFAKGMADVDWDVFHTVDATPTKTMYVHAIGHPLKGMIYQQRTPFEMLLYDEPHWVDANNGLLVTLRERFVFAYGDFRRMVKHVYTT
jgi:hypothetical protein